MLCICFHIAEQVYAVRATDIDCILPRMSATPIPQAPSWCSGVIKVQSQGLLLIDFCQMLHQRVSRKLFSTRIIVLRCHDRDGHAQRLGLLAEGVTGTVRFQQEGLHRLTLDMAETPWLREVITDDRGMVQLLNVDQLYSDELADMLIES